MDNDAPADGIAARRLVADLAIVGRIGPASWNG